VNVGLRIKYIQYLDEFISSSFENVSGIKMLELGNQKIRNRRKYGLPKTGKQYFESLGMKHNSIDLNGLDGALRLDLSKPIDKKEWLNNFDVVTNFGTTEHIEPIEGQYECFKNIHNFLSVGGICVNIIPASDAEKFERFLKQRHCNNFYTKEFFDIMTKESGYKLLNSHHRGAYIWSCYKKVSDAPFMENKNLFLSKITRTDSGRTYSYGEGGEFIFS
jgi:hypothetical protein